MKVSEILKRKGTAVQKIRPETTLGEAARELSEANIGAVLVCDVRGTVLGVLSERDIVRRIAAEGPGALELAAGEAMTSRVVSCRPDDAVDHVMSVMTHRRIRHLPVMVGDELLGLISIGDVVKNVLEEMQLEVNVLRDYARARCLRGLEPDQHAVMIRQRQPRSVGEARARA